MKLQTTIIILITLFFAGCGKKEDVSKESEHEAYQIRSKTEIISAKKGGVVKLGRAEISIPAQTLEKDAEIKINICDKRPQIKPGSKVRYLGNTYDITSSASLKGEVTVTLPYIEIPDISPETEKTLFIGVWDGSEWRNVGGEVDKKNKTISVKVNHFCLLSVLFELLTPVGSFLANLSSADIEISKLDKAIKDDMNSMTQYGDIEITSARMSAIPQWVKISVLVVEILDFINDNIFNPLWEMLQLSIEKIMVEHLAALQAAGMLSPIIAGGGIGLYSGGLSSAGAISGKAIFTAATGTVGRISVVTFAGLILLEAGDFLRSKIPEPFENIWTLNPHDSFSNEKLFLITSVSFSGSKQTKEQICITSGIRFYYLNTLEKKWISFGETANTVNIDLKLKEKVTFKEEELGIAFVSEKDGKKDLYSINIEDKIIKILTSDISGSIMPSPNGEYIAFETKKSGKKNIYLIKSDGSEERILTKIKPINVPDWTSWNELDSWVPKSNSIMIRQCTGKLNTDWIVCENCLLDIKTDSITPANEIVPIPEKNFGGLESNVYGYVRWSQDGQKAIYTEVDMEETELWLTGLEYKQPKKLFTAGGIPIWFPDSTHILYRSSVYERSELREQLLVANVETLETRPFTFYLNDKLNDIERLAMPPKGNLIALVNQENGKYNLFILDWNEKSLKRIKSGLANIYSLSWSPEGELIAFLSDDDSNEPALYVIKPDGESFKRLIGVESGHHIQNLGWISVTKNNEMNSDDIVREGETTKPKYVVDKSPRKYQFNELALVNEEWFFPGEIDKRQDGLYAYDFMDPEQIILAFYEAIKNKDIVLLKRITTDELMASLEKHLLPKWDVIVYEIQEMWIERPDIEIRKDGVYIGVLSCKGYRRTGDMEFDKIDFKIKRDNNHLKIFDLF